MFSDTSSGQGFCSFAEPRFYEISPSTCGPETELEGEAFEGPDRGIPVGPEKNHPRKH